MSTEYLAAQPQQDQNIDQNKRDYNDLTTLFAEMVNGSMRTPFEYSCDGQELYASDGSAMRLEFEKGLEHADDMADARPNLAFEVRRRRHEIDEYYDMLKMARGQLPNTMVVVSDFPPELADATHDLGGYNVERKQTMLRVLAWDGQTMKMYSQSLDRSDRHALEAIYASLGARPRADELLGQRLHVQLDAAEQDLLTDKLTAVYDHHMHSRYGGEWHAGRQELHYFNTYDFVRQQHDLLQHAMVQKRAGKLDIFAIAATLEQRFQQNVRIAPATIIARNNDAQHNLRAELDQSTAAAHLMGRVFSACGITVEQTGPSLGGQMEFAGYGNKTNESSEYKFDKKMYCVVCQDSPEKSEPRKMCGPCGICKKCDKKLSTKR